ncbi:MAG: helix-hairpin-helix domain-containing protein [Candidatus Hodarchaeota archaeon]
MESKQKPIAIVKSPAKDGHARKGKGFSLKEIKEAGKTIESLRKLNIQIDFLRKSVLPENIEKLKSFDIPKEKRKKREPFVKKEKKRTPFKVKAERPKVVPAKKVAVTPKKPVIKPKPIKKEKVKKEIEVIEVKGTALTQLTGLGAATAKKFMELGVNNIEELSKENPEELATLIKGVSEERLKKWIEEATELIK